MANLSLLWAILGAVGIYALSLLPAVWLFAVGLITAVTIVSYMARRLFTQSPRPDWIRPEDHGAPYGLLDELNFVEDGKSNQKVDLPSLPQEWIENLEAEFETVGEDILFFSKPSSSSVVSEVEQIDSLVQQFDSRDKRRLILTRMKFDRDKALQQHLIQKKNVSGLIYRDLYEKFDLLSQVDHPAQISRSLIHDFINDMKQRYDEIILYLPKSELPFWQDLRLSQPTPVRRVPQKATASENI